MVFITSRSGKTTEIILENEITVRDLKTTYYQKCGLPVKKQSLIFNGNLLEDDVKIADSDITNDCTLQIVLLKEAEYIEPATPDDISINFSEVD